MRCSLVSPLQPLVPEVQELLAERGINVDHSTIWRWVQRYAPELAQRQRAHLKPTNKSWRVDETYVRVKGEWCYLYRAVDSEGATVEFFLSGFRDKESAQSLFRRAIRHGAPPPRVINTDLAPTYPTAIAGLKRSGDLPRRCRHRPVQYLNNIVEQDHRFVKKRIVAKAGVPGVRICAAHCRWLRSDPSNEERAGAMVTSPRHRAPEPLHRPSLRPRPLTM